MADGLYETNQLPFVSCKMLVTLAMGLSSWCSTAPNPESDASHSTKNSHMKSRRESTDLIESALECLECHLRLLVPGEALLEYLGKGSC